MAQMLMGKKRGMTQLFDEKGQAVVVTVVEAEPNVIVQIKTDEKDGYTAIQQGFDTIKTKDPRTVANRTRKPQEGHFAKNNIPPTKHLAESRIQINDDMQPGQTIDVSIFSEGEFVDVTAMSIGKGYQGGMKLYNYRGGRATHGNSKAHRSIGSTGMRSTPGRCLPGGKRANHMGYRKKTVQNLKVVGVNTENNTILIKGAVPGPRNSLVYLQTAVKKQKNQGLGR